MSLISLPRILNFVELKLFLENSCFSNRVGLAVQELVFKGLKETVN